MDCNSPCVVNPTHLTADSFSSWRWNPAERCWLQVTCLPVAARMQVGDSFFSNRLSHLEHAQDTGMQHCGSLLAAQVNKANATANELYAAHLILRGLAATVRLTCIRCRASLT